MSDTALDSDEPLFELGAKYTERHMLDLLHQRYGTVNPGNGPRYACAEHVKNAAGFDAGRVADFIAIDCWPSSGLELHGHEVKVSRSDWLTELKKPEKAEAFKRYMDRWWLVVPDAKIIKAGELPDGWGLLVLSKRRSMGSWPDYHPRIEDRLRVATPAPQLNPEAIPRELLAPLLRSTAKTAKRRAHDTFCTAPCNHPSRLLV